MKITRAVVPSLFTVLNIFCGFLSLIHTTRGDYPMASWFIILAAIFDVLDGLMARITKSSSDFGVEFDSLSDIVSFGVAPSFLIYHIHPYAQSGFGILLSSMPMVFGALRLARFNANLVGYDKEFFNGLPIPASAVTIGTFVISLSLEGTGLSNLGASLLAPMVVVLSLLMVSTLKYDTAPKFTRRDIQQHPVRFTITIVCFTAIVVTEGQALFPIFVLYIFSGPLRYGIKFLHHLIHHGSKDLEEKETEVSSVDI